MDPITLSQERSYWSIHRAESGQLYYYNLKTGQSQWDKPACLVEGDEEQEVTIYVQRKEDWQQYMTMDGRPYWYHSKLKESRWTKPEAVQYTKQDDNADDSDEEAPPDPIKEFMELLHEQNIPLTMKWDQAVKNLSNDYRWRVIGSISEKKRLFNQYMDELKKVEKDEQKVRFSYAKEEFFKMLEEFRINSSDKKFWQVASALVNDPRWKAIPEEKERENLFQDHLDKLYAQERENMKVMRKSSIEEFGKKLLRYIDSKMIDHSTSWDQCLKLFSQDRLLQTMQPVDALGVFEETVNPLYEQYRQQLRQKYRNNRIAFRELLQASIADGLLTHKTKWRDFVQTLLQEPRFINMIGQPGSQPHELFQDFMAQIQQNHQVYKSELKTFFKEKGLKSIENMSFEQFNQVFQGNDVWSKMAEFEQKYYFRYFQQNTRSKDSNTKRQKKLVKRFIKLLKTIPTINAQSSYDLFEAIIQQKINSEHPKLAQMSEDLRRQTFENYQIDTQSRNDSQSEKKKKKKKKNKKRKSEQSASEESAKQSDQEQEYEPKVEKKRMVTQTPALVAIEAEDGEIADPVENVINVKLLEEEAGEVIEEHEKSRSKKHKNKHKRDYEEKHKSEKHHKKSKKRYK